MNKEIAKRGSSLIKDGYSIMTHCHSGEACAVIEHAWKEGKKYDYPFKDLIPEQAKASLEYTVPNALK
jgi:methylthioribose-1-phosphate isomerase